MVARGLVDQIQLELTRYLFWQGLALNSPRPGGS